jgi:hypothetical protein
MDTSAFMDKTTIPDDASLKDVLGDLSKVWTEIRNYVFDVYPNALEEWSFAGQKYGWSFRIKDKKRAIIYLLPRKEYFLVAFVFGDRPTKDALSSNLSGNVKDIIASARVYAEGRGFRIEVRNEELTNDIKTLIDLKLLY